MAHKSRPVDLRQREQRQRGYASSQTVSMLFPRVKELTLDLRFTGVHNKLLFSPYKQIYTADMQAFFELQCPSIDCSDGGFDLRLAVARAAQNPAEIGHGRLACRGVSAAGESKGAACSVEMTFAIEVSVDSEGR